VLLSEYPFLSGRGAVLPAALAFIAPLASAGQGSRAWDVTFQAAICSCYVALLVLMHFYDLSRRRIHALAEVQGVGVGRNFTFTSPELQESFEVWRMKGLFWRALDWGTFVILAAFTLKVISLWEACGPLHRLWALGAAMSWAPRVLFLSRLSSRGHSALGLFCYTYSWVTRGIMLLYGDECVVASFGRHLFSGSVAGSVLSSILLHISGHLLTPVSQALLPWKMSTGLLGFTLMGYLHVLRQEGGIDWTVDKDRWGLLMLVIGQAITSLAIFSVCTAVTEAGMGKFLATQQRAAVTR
jgi:hypothetical protein